MVEQIESVGLTRTLANFRSGELQFGHQRRFDESLAELERREQSADVRVSALIREGYRDRVLMLTHNHPHPVLVNEIAQQIADRLDLAYSPIGPDEHLRYSTITLPETRKLFSPYGVAELGLKIPYDLHWLKIGRELISDISEAIGVGRAKKRRHQSGSGSDGNTDIGKRVRAQREAAISDSIET